MMTRRILAAAVAATALIGGVAAVALADGHGGGRGGAMGHHDMGGMMGDHSGGGMMGGPEGGMDTLFDRFDADGDGRVTRAEAFDGPAARFAAADADRDGKLTPDEFAAMLRAEADLRAARAFARHDLNGDGAIDAFEAPRPPMERMGRMFARMDADSDGVVTREEAEAARERMRAHMRDGRGPGRGRDGDDG